ncbi:MAG: tetratricopeptide (TPR) repeat protein [Methylophagaceae bacterium]|jgi:tetratricopeptide (TPR) repeat protein
MDLSQVMWKKLNRLIRSGWLASCLVLLSACVAVPSEAPNPEASPLADVAPIVIEEKPVETLPLTAELTYLILTAEMAAQRGDIISADELYNRAAGLIESPSISARSTQIANFTQDEKRIDRALERWAEVDPTDADIYMLQAPFLLLKGQYSKVAPAVNQAISLAPEKSALYLGRLTDNLSKLVKAGPALKIMSQLDVFVRDDPNAIYQYSRLASYYKRYEIALPAIEKALDKQADFDEALILKSKILQRLNRKEEALQTLKSAANEDDATPQLRFTYARLLGENGNIDLSQLYFEQLNTEQDDLPDVIFALGVIAIEKKEGEKAKSYFDRLLDLGDPGRQAAYFLGLAEELSGNVEQAIVWFTSVPNDNPRFQAAQTHYVTLLADNGAMAKARQHLSNIRAANPKLAIQYYLFESSFLRERELKQASYDILDEALIEDPDNIDLLYGRAMAAESIERIDWLERDLRAILEIDPINSQTLNALGYTLADRTGRHIEALELIKEALLLVPNDPFYLDSLGWAYYRLGDLDKAVLYLKQAIKLQEDPEFLAHLGEVLWQQGEVRQAKKVWQQGLDLDFDNKLLRDTMQQFGL